MLRAARCVDETIQRRKTMKYTYVSALAVVMLLTPTAFAESGADFLNNAVKGDNSEIMLGKLAQQKGATAEVRKFGTTLVTDHTKAKTQAAMLASSMSLSLPGNAMPEAQSEADKLSKMSGAEFDREFVSYMVSDHQKDIEEFTKEAEANDGKVSALAKKQLPTLKKHLKLAQTLQSKTQSSMNAIQPPQRIQ
jgi:putative membrane protein